MLRWLISGALLCALCVPAGGHEMHQGQHKEHHAEPSWSYLYGKHAQSGNVINCCTYGGARVDAPGHGDCREVHPLEIEEADGPNGEPGFRYRGFWFARKNTNASPDGKTYICQHAGSAPHCGFVTEARG
jgi:hypothetical protein